MKRLINFGKNSDVQNTIDLTNSANSGQILHGLSELRAEQNRGRIVLAILFVAILFLVGAGGYGLIDGSFEKLQIVWAVVAAPFGAVVAHYFSGVKAQEKKSVSSVRSED